MTMDGYQQQYPYGFQGAPTSYSVGIPGMPVFSNQTQSYGGAAWGSPIDLSGGNSFSNFSPQGSPYAFQGFGDIIQSLGFSQGVFPDFSQGYGSQNYPNYPAEAGNYSLGTESPGNSTYNEDETTPPPPLSEPPPSAPVPPPPQDASNGSNSDGYINNDTKQQSEGDCVFLSTTRGISETDQGRTDIKNAIKANDDGSYDVKFKGSDKTYHVSKDDANKQGQWANGDKDMQVLGSAADQYFKDHGHASGVSGLGFGDVSQLLTGKTGSTTSLTGKNSVDDIKKQLMDAAPNLGKTTSIGLSGGVGDNATWKAQDTSHEFQIQSIDTKTGMVTYTNPWDTSVKHTISADDLAKQLAANPNGSTIDIFNAA